MLVFGLLLAFGALMLRLQGMAFGEPSPGDDADDGVLAADRSPISGWCCSPAIYLPPPLVAWFQHVAAMLR